MIDPDSLVSTIERKGWRVERLPTGWQLARPGLEAAIYLSFTPSWICLHAPVESPGSAADDEQSVRLYRYLLGCNEAMFVARFCRDSVGRLVLHADVPGGSSVHRIDYALDALTRSLTLYGPELVAGALDLMPGTDRAARELYFDEPPGIPHEVIGSYVRAVEPHGWLARNKPKGITWPLGYKGQRMFEVYLTITRSWTCFHIPAMIEVPAAVKEGPWAVQRAFLEYLLRVNDAWYMAKTGMDEVGRVLIMLEVPTQELDFDLFRLITRLLAAYLNLYAREVQIMAHLPSDPKLRPMLAP